MNARCGRSDVHGGHMADDGRLCVGNRGPAIVEAPTARAALDQKIHAAMDGVYWDADTFDAIADVLTRAGYVIAPPADDVDHIG